MAKFYFEYIAKQVRETEIEADDAATAFEIFFNERPGPDDSVVIGEVDEPHQIITVRDEDQVFYR